MSERKLDPLDELFCRHVAQGHRPEDALRAAGLHQEISADLGAKAWARPEVRARVAELRVEVLSKRVARATSIMDMLKRLAERGMAIGDTKNARLALSMMDEVREGMEQEVRNGGPLEPPPSPESLMAMAASWAAEFSADGMLGDVPLPFDPLPGAHPANTNPASANPKTGRPAKRGRPARRQPGSRKPSRNGSSSSTTNSDQPQ
ncbi:hypothetical protein [Arenibaculum sp.]|uniref:hypothetical protein n=1 Tax=Arenibaculum sp. TaxID=2865862 RepID=UPI002E0F0332|nr:hypothetical protein [Arenibaculum sp.]